MNTTKTSYLSLGSNLGDRAYLLQKAIFMLQERAGDIQKISSVYETPSWGFESGKFLNLCIGLQTSLPPHELLTIILQIEENLGRQRAKEATYQARSIDIDILYYDDEVIESPKLVLPHPQLHKRRFVLRPLADIAPQFYHPVLAKDSRNLLQQCGDKSTIEKTSHRFYKDMNALFSGLNFVAIEGNIGAGKSTLARMIANDFNAKLVLERFADNPFLPKFYKDQNRYAFPLEMSFLADRYQQFTDDTSQFDLFKQFMVSDYDIYKSLIFAKITLQKDEFLLYRKLFDFMYREVKKPKIYMYLYQDTERLLENIRKRGRDYEQNISADYLEKINRGYFDFIRGYPDQNNLVLDINNLDFVASSKDYKTVLDKILQFAANLSY
ncbi:2-amino-4-hydroxy-6-hydroxymethyldihydropteridine diphosphokinase [Muriicola sp. Z0-33]|uniref:2-amino-4-hydroxy-6- hydroxymethyldihydropteridine diphosphokinase n=1 Tax=Muriicola sp. Z0-33 TaxID=2816957 RepID=UPI002238E245|nr:2-amino-4-hydroxy-6-hydroxymethyldihydropteridine diphosphokinase [Muriicola sp. Z0-33]MCW5516149.1 2-amino-4-hydroxy-6-hydroxymethyldihydropteridine diphosphokinase [Muriicola sp. Z0-33]